MTEQELDKACEWLDFHLLDYHLGEQQVNKVIEDFRKAMTEKTNPLFEQCLANVNPEIRAEVRRNMEDLL